MSRESSPCSDQEVADYRRGELLGLLLDALSDEAPFNCLGRELAETLHFYLQGYQLNWCLIGRKLFALIFDVSKFFFCFVSGTKF